MRLTRRGIGYFLKYSPSSTRKRADIYAIHTEGLVIFKSIHEVIRASVRIFMRFTRREIDYFLKYRPSSTRKPAVSYTIHTCLRFGYILQYRPSSTSKHVRNDAIHT